MEIDRRDGRAVQHPHMTQAHALELLRELHSLERLEAVIKRPDNQAPEWGYALTLIDHRLY